MIMELTDDVAVAAFVQGWIVFKYSRGRRTAQMIGNNFDLAVQGNLGIRDHGGQKECMGVVAKSTGHPADPEGEPAIRSLHKTVVVPVDRKRSGMAAAGAGELMELEPGNDIIIKIWS